MNIPPPQSRKCEKCLNTMTLNLFRLNSSECRYCQDGLNIPKRILIDNVPVRNEAPENQVLQRDESAVPLETNVQSDLTNGNERREQINDEPTGEILLDESIN